MRKLPDNLPWELSIFVGILEKPFYTNYEQYEAAMWYKSAEDWYNQQAVNIKWSYFILFTNVEEKIISFISMLGSQSN